MRFEPKIVRSSEAVPDELEAGLPDDLAMLAAQLHDDAAQLASLYPAKAACDVPQALPPRRVLTWFMAGTLACVLLALAIALPWLLPGPAWNVADHHQADLVDLASGDLASGETDRDASESQGKSDQAAPAVSTPALFLQNVSGPELEGLFDLWEADAVEQSRISI